MPIIQVNLIEGRPPEKIEKLIELMTDAAVNALDAPRESVRIMVNEYPRNNFGIGGVTAQKLGR
ncbi:2-hydroxymuconate tautomerase family protein [Aquitalea denitrificans]|jgi:4-oxalocrotonate tautomerase|uniref:2-hydroxymuconate tautomerase family protein n=1 Tax=Aquitalea denitrificans TaxID=519081 RepID=UPI00135CF092|nr:2-hydroxymuconate tautomerase family protein [Aquitalea denitrificans]